MSTALPVSSSRIRIGPLGAALPVVAAVALVVASVARLRLDLSAPLWLDESWTAAFAAEPTLGALTSQVRDDANAPAYYYLIWLWARAFGTSNLALHLPSLTIGLLTPAIAWFGLRQRHPGLALGWAALLATWVPGIGQSGEARCYTLLSCAAVLVTLAHLRLLEAPTLRRAAIWAAAAAAMTLVHYQAGLLAAAQGLAFLGLHRARVFRFWPAALTTVPAFAWIAWHAPRLSEFVRPDVAWYDIVTLADCPAIALFLVNGPYGLAALIAALIACARRDPDGEEPLAISVTALRWAGGAALAAAAACILLGMLRPSFTIRYLTPFVPGLMLLVVHWVAGHAERRTSALVVLMVGNTLAAIPMAFAAPNAGRSVYGFEPASTWLKEAAPRRLVFFWDHPATPVETRRQLDAVGGVFLRRAGLTLDVTPVYPAAADMNATILAAAGEDAAILWLYDTDVHHTSARTNKPRLAERDLGLECRDFGAGSIGVVACRRRMTR